MTALERQALEDVIAEQRAELRRERDEVIARRSSSYDDEDREERICRRASAVDASPEERAALLRLK